MKYLFIYLAVIITTTKCHVSNNTKTAAVASIDNEPTQSALKFEAKHEKVKELNVETSSVYLEDVLYGIRNYDWTGQEACLNRTLALLAGLQNFTLWAVWRQCLYALISQFATTLTLDWDSISSQPQGLLYGNQYQLGNFEECMHPSWLATHPELSTQYCVADITLETTNKHVTSRKIEPFNPYQSAVDYLQYQSHYKLRLNQLTWGICVPAECSANSVQQLLEIMLARSHLGTAGLRPSFSGEYCQKTGEGPVYDGQFYGFVIMVVLLVLVAITCTLYRQKKIKQGCSYDNPIIKAFCLLENSSNLLMMKKEGTEVLYGIRTLAIMQIVFAHQIGMFNSGAVSDAVKIDNMFLSVAIALCMRIDLFVDTFFVLSGFLMAVALLRSKRIINPLVYIIKRYNRLAVGLAVIIFYQAAMMAHTGSGPLWPRVAEGESQACRKTWWLSLLMLGNYVDTQNMCNLTFWYIPVDFHFSVIAILVFWCYQHSKKTGNSIFIMLGMASVIVPAVITYTDDLPPIQLFNHEFVSNPRLDRSYHSFYMKSHARFATYLIGFIAGYIYTRLKKREGFKMPQLLAITGTVLSVAVTVAVMMTGSLILWAGPVERAVYAALNRPVWGAAACTLLLCTSLGHVPILNSFLKWYPFVPLSRLAYGVYLTHTLFITRNVFSTRNPTSNDGTLLVIQWLGVTVLSFLSSYLIWLFAEAPVNNLVSMLLVPKKNNNTRDITSTDMGTDTRNTSLDNIESHSGHLERNLNKPIQYSSKF